MKVQLLILACTCAVIEALTVCPGDDRGGTCAFDDTHRVCANILSTSGTDHDFWEVTGQSDFKDSWVERMSVDGWCICKWATAEYIQANGCHADFFDCEATDVENLCASYDDFDVNLKPARDCIMQACPQYATTGYCATEASANQQKQDSTGLTKKDSTVVSINEEAAFVGFAACALVLVAAAVVFRQRSRASMASSLKTAQFDGQPL